MYGGYHRIVAECEPPSVSPSALVGQLTTACASSVIHSNGQATYLCHWGASHDVVSKTASIDRRKADGLRQASGSPGEERRPVPSPRSTRRLITTNRDESNNNSSIITNKSDSKVDSIPSDLRGSRESLDGLLSEMQGSRLFKKQQTPSVPPMPSPRVNRRTSGEAGTLPYDVVGPVCECADFLGLQVSLELLQLINRNHQKPYCRTEVSEHKSTIGGASPINIRRYQYVVGRTNNFFICVLPKSAILFV